MKLREPIRYLKQTGSNHIYVWAESLAARPDMVEYFPEAKPEPKPEPKPEAQETKPFEIKKASKKE